MKAPHGSEGGTMASRAIRIAAAIGVTLSAGLTQGAASARAQTIVDEWPSVKIPPAPELKRVKADPKTMAFLALDFLKPTCNAQQEPRCLASVPKVAKFLDAARAHHMLVVESVSPVRPFTDILPEVAPKGDEPIVRSAADKFINTDLEKILKDHGITTVIVVGRESQGAVLYTTSHATFLGFKAVVPVDGSSGVDAFAELAAAWTLANAPGVGAATTLTRFDMIDW
ncbi:MAG TPA: isochorismatase family protein, partial [Beijerinckiaceae bacterium]|nr:isochorismatase family protein [Beijerinckiaceae bacterium]